MSFTDGGGHATITQLQPLPSFLQEAPQTESPYFLTPPPFHMQIRREWPWSSRDNLPPPAHTHKNSGSVCSSRSRVVAVAAVASNNCATSTRRPRERVGGWGRGRPLVPTTYRVVVVAVTSRSLFVSRKDPASSRQKSDPQAHFRSRLRREAKPYLM